MDVDLQEESHRDDVAAGSPAVGEFDACYLLSGERHHVQGAVHETSRHRLDSVLGEDGVIHTVVSRHILRVNTQMKVLHIDMQENPYAFISNVNDDQYFILLF